MATESDIQLITGGNGPVLRTIQVTTLLNGEPTVVNMEVAAISDPNGTLLFPPTDRQDEILTVLKQIALGVSMLLAIVSDTPQITDILQADLEGEDLN
jgi:hypothetical protein